MIARSILIHPTRFVLFALVAVAGACGRQDDRAPARADARNGGTARDRVAARVDARVARFLRQTYVPGVSVAVIRGRDTLVLRGYGMADVEKRIAATERTVYPIASLTKQFTAAAVMRLVEEGRLSLDDSIGRHLSGLPAPWRGVRVRQLLNHTSGLPDSPLVLAREVPPDTVIARAMREPPLAAPGTAFSYNNVGYLLLGRLIERVSGEPYGRYVETRILAPNGLASTRMCRREATAQPRAAGYVVHDTTVVDAPADALGPRFAAGGLCSTVGDLAAWNRALASGRVVSPASWARMTTPEGAARGAAYGYGVSVRPLDGHRMVAHGGAQRGFQAANARLPDDSLSVTVLTNFGPEDPGTLLLDIVRIVLADSASASARR